MVMDEDILETWEAMHVWCKLRDKIAATWRCLHHCSRDHETGDHVSCGFENCPLIKEK
jgi:hypothetical protein